MSEQRVSPHELFGHPWAIRESEFRRVIAGSLAFEANPEAFSFLLQTQVEEPRLYELVEGVAIVRVRGALFRQASYFSRFFGDRTYAGIAEAFQAALDAADVSAIVLDIDSPGGDALGLSELADRIFEARGQKPITAVVRGLGASAAYFIAAAADRIVAAREALVGSIGTVATYLDFRKLDERVGIQEIAIVSSQSPKKRPDPITDEGRAQLQRQVDDIAQVFVVSVARYRGVSVEKVLSDYGQGEVLVGQRAVEAGLVDELSTLDDVIASAPRPAPKPERAEPRSAEDESEWRNVEEVAASWGIPRQEIDRLMELSTPRHAAAELIGIRRRHLAQEETHDPIEAWAASMGRLEPGQIEEADRTWFRDRFPTATPTQVERAVAREREQRAAHLAALQADEDALSHDHAPGHGHFARQQPSGAELGRAAVALARKNGLVE